MKALERGLLAGLKSEPAGRTGQREEDAPDIILPSRLLEVGKPQQQSPWPVDQKCPGSCPCSGTDYVCNLGEVTGQPALRLVFLFFKVRGGNAGSAIEKWTPGHGRGQPKCAAFGMMNMSSLLSHSGLSYFI